MNLSIYNAALRLVVVVIDESRPAGPYATVWNGKDEDGTPTTSGACFYRLSAKEFGAWGLFDDAPRMLTCTAAGDCRLLKIEREEFLQILSDGPYITEHVLRKIVKKMRTLMTHLNTWSEIETLRAEILKTFL